MKHRILSGFVILPFALSVSLAQTPAITPGGTVNAATNAAGQPVAAGSLVSIYGNALAAGLALASSVPLSTSLNGTSVTINGIPAPLDFVAPTQINAQVPFELLGTNGAVNVVVTSNNQTSIPQPVVLNPTAPGIFSATTPSGVVYAIAYYGVASDPRFLTYAWPANAYPGLTTSSAKPGDILTVYATGLGAVNPPAQTGNNSLDQIRNTAANTTVLVGNANAQVYFSGLSPYFPGVYQLNIGVPQVTPGDKVPIQIQIGGVTSAANVFIGVAAP